MLLAALVNLCFILREHSPVTLSELDSATCKYKLTSGCCVTFLCMLQIGADHLDVKIDPVVNAMAALLSGIFGHTPRFRVSSSALRPLRSYCSSYLGLPS